MQNIWNLLIPFFATPKMKHSVGEGSRNPVNSGQTFSLSDEAIKLNSKDNRPCLLQHQSPVV